MAWDHCTAVVDGEECGLEQCASVHMVASGHDFQEGPS